MANIPCFENALETTKIRSSFHPVDVSEEDEEFEDNPILLTREEAISYRCE